MLNVRIRNIFIIILLIIFFVSCKKDNHPEVISISEVKAEPTYWSAEISGRYESANDVLATNIYYYTEDKSNVLMKEVSVDSINFYVNIDGLEHSTTYYYYIESKSTHSSIVTEEYSFRTLDPVMPDVKTSELVFSSVNVAICGGEVVSEGTFPVILRGVCWSLDGVPTVENDVTTDGYGTGRYTSVIDNLIKDTIYYYRAYATTEAGSAYGDIVSFQTMVVE